LRKIAIGTWLILAYWAVIDSAAGFFLFLMILEGFELILNLGFLYKLRRMNNET